MQHFPSASERQTANHPLRQMHSKYSNQDDDVL